MTLQTLISNLTKRIILEREKIKLEREIAQLVRNQQIIDELKNVALRYVGPGIVYLTHAEANRYRVRDRPTLSQDEVSPRIQFPL
jgi:hypothetical protein